MASSSLTLDQLRNVAYPKNSPERAQQKALEDKAVGTFVDAMNKFDYADSNAQNRELELEVTKVRDRTGVPVRYESSFWDKGSLIFPKEMNQASVMATLVKITKAGEALPIEGNQEEGYSVTVSDLASAAPDLVEAAKAEQQQELIDLKAALTDAANKTLEAHGWDLSGYNHRWQKLTSHADSLPQTTQAVPVAVRTTVINPPAVEIYAASAQTFAERPSSAVSKPVSIGVEQAVVAPSLPEKTRHLSHYAELKAQNAIIVAEMRELVEKTRQAALESASASKAVIQSLGGLNADVLVAESSDPQKNANPSITTPPLPENAPRTVIT